MNPDEQLDDIQRNVDWLEARMRRTRDPRRLREIQQRLRIEGENLKRLFHQNAQGF